MQKQIYVLEVRLFIAVFCRKKNDHGFYFSLSRENDEEHGLRFSSTPNVSY